MKLSNNIFSESESTDKYEKDCCNFLNEKFKDSINKKNEVFPYVFDAIQVPQEKNSESLISETDVTKSDILIKNIKTNKDVTYVEVKKLDHSRAFGTNFLFDYVTVKDAKKNTKKGILKVISLESFQNEIQVDKIVDFVLDEEIKTKYSISDKQDPIKFVDLLEIWLNRYDTRFKTIVEQQLRKKSGEKTFNENKKKFFGNCLDILSRKSKRGQKAACYININDIQDVTARYYLYKGANYIIYNGEMFYIKKDKAHLNNYIKDKKNKIRDFKKDCETHATIRISLDKGLQRMYTDMKKNRFISKNQTNILQPGDKDTVVEVRIKHPEQNKNIGFKINLTTNESIEKYDFIKEQKTTETVSNKFEIDTTDNIRNFLKSQDDEKYQSLDVAHYEESDSKYWSDIKITNPKTIKNIWVEAKLNKYANLGSASFKYTDGEWTCSTLEEDDPLHDIYLNALKDNIGKFIDFCKEYLGKDDISLPKDITEDLVEAWKATGSVDDTDNDTYFITNKIQLDEFGFKIAEFYKYSKTEPAYYMQCGDDLYIIDPNYNPLGLKCRNGEPLKPLSEAYRIGRIQFRLKGQNKVNGTAKRKYYSIFVDVKILSDKENLDKEYSCSFNDEDKWPVIDDGEQTTYKTKEAQVANEDEMEITEQIEKICKEDAVDDVINDMKKVKSTNQENPDKILTKNGRGLLIIMDVLDGRLILVNPDGERMMRDDNGGYLYFDDPKDAVKWAEERGYEVEKNYEHKNFQDVGESKPAAFRLKDKEDTYKPDENNYRFKNKSEKYGGDDYINSMDIMDRIDPNLRSKFGPRNWFQGPDCMDYRKSSVYMKIDDGKDSILPITDVKRSSKYRLLYLVSDGSQAMNVSKFSRILWDDTKIIATHRKFLLVYMNKDDDSVYVCNGIEPKGDDVIFDMEWGDPIEYSEELNEDIVENEKEVKLLTNVSKDVIENILDNTHIENKRFDRSQFTKYFGQNDIMWCVLADSDDNLAIAAINENMPFKGYAYIAEIQTIKKGYGRLLILELMKKYDKLWLMANTAAGETLLDYYRKFGFEEIVIPDSIWECPAYFFCTRKCDYDKLRDYCVAFYSNDNGDDGEEDEI